MCLIRYLVISENGDCPYLLSFYLEGSYAISSVIPVLLIKHPALPSPAISVSV